MTDARRALGEYGERLAARYLTDQGFVVLDRNWRCQYGEIDLVARHRHCLVVCEVKTRRSTAYGTPADAVTPRKAARLKRLAGCWLEAHPRTGTRDLRIDVLAILRPAQGPAQITHFAGIG